MAIMKSFAMAKSTFTIDAERVHRNLVPTAKILVEKNKNLVLRYKHSFTPKTVLKVAIS